MRINAEYARQSHREPYLVVAANMATVNLPEETFECSKLVVTLAADCEEACSRANTVLQDGVVPVMALKLDDLLWLVSKLSLLDRATACGPIWTT